MTNASPHAAAIADELSRSGGPRIIALVDLLLAEACQRKASDLHLVPTRDGLRARMRVDGVLCDAFSFLPAIRSEIINRIKVVAGLRTDEHFAAQDGRARHALPDGSVLDLRVSVAPTVHGENAVLRLLPASTTVPTLGELGYGDTDAARINEAMRRSGGMVLVTGPTGSGKTTTLYALLRLRDSRTSSLVTLEDPVEYEMDAVTQMRVAERGGLTFAGGLRAILRQDPDVIMVGEIRDAETAGVAVNAALTGHLLLSTLHTNDAASAIPRLLDLGVEPYLLASTVSLVIAQRLVRKVCVSCGGATGGCGACGGTGFVGRAVIAETLAVDDAMLAAMTSRRPTAAALAKLAVAAGMTTLKEHGEALVRRGVTTAQEVQRVLS